MYGRHDDADTYRAIGAILLYATLGTEFILRYVKDRPIRKFTEPIRRLLDDRMKLMLGALVFSTTCLFIR